MHAKKKSKQMRRTQCWLRKSNWNENESVRTMHKNEKDVSFLDGTMGAYGPIGERDG